MRAVRQGRGLYHDGLRTTLRNLLRDKGIGKSRADYSGRQTFGMDAFSDIGIYAALVVGMSRSTHNISLLPRE